MKIQGKSRIALLVMLALPLTAYADSKPTSDPAKPERGNPEWLMRHGERVADVKSNAEKLEVLFIGDSITGGWRDIGKAIWEKECVPLHAVNIGIAGSQTQHILWQFENGAIDGINPRVAVLMIGVNNVVASPSHSAADIARGISAIVARLREKLPRTRILLLGTFPKDRAPGTPDRRKIQEINALIAKLDDGKRIRFLDIGVRLLGKDGNLNADVSRDGVHLTEKGYQIWADAMRPLLHEMLADASITTVGQKPLNARPEWEMGPFVKRDKPILSPTPDSKFQCPILGKEVRWEEQNVYNPAAVVRDGKVYLLYRADDKNPALKWGRTCRIGLASSEDGINFTRHPTPVLYPDNDPWKKYEWEGGCEDLHIVEGEDGTYYMNYTTWNGGSDTMSVASSPDLVHWTKHGPAFRKATPDNVGGRSGVVISKLVGDHLVAAKINGKYWMYYTHPSALAWSDNLIDWTRAGKSVWGGDHEAGAIALLRDKDILLMFNTQGWGNGWTLGQALVDGHDLTTILKYPDKPFLYPELEWEKRGFAEPAVVANTLVPFKGQWLLYYGAADRCIGLAVCVPPRDTQPAGPGPKPPLPTPPKRGQAMIYRPATGKMWDPSILWHEGKYYLFSMYMPKESNDWKDWTGIWLATSADGVHWEDYGEVLPRARAQSPHPVVYKCFVARCGDRLIMNHGAFAGRPGPNNDTLCFYESRDLVHWNLLNENHPDTRWYNEGGRWDHMYMAPKEEGNPRTGYWGWLVANPKPEQCAKDRAFGMMESSDGTHWAAIEPPLAVWSGLDRIHSLEIGGVERIGGKYFLIGGIGFPHYLQQGGYSMFTFVSDRPTGPFKLDREAWRLCGTSGYPGRMGGGGVQMLASWARGNGELLISNYTEVPEVALLPLRKPVVDAAGHLRLGYWKTNDLAKGDAIALGSERVVALKTEPPSAVPGTRDSRAVTMLSPAFDLGRGLILEGNLKAEFNGVPPCYAGFYLEEKPGEGTGILLEVGDARTRRSYIGPLRVAPAWDFRSFDVTGPGCATVTGLDPGKKHSFRLWIRGSIFELYVDDLLMQTLITRGPPDRIGFLVQNGEAVFSDLKAWKMNL